MLEPHVIVLIVGIALTCYALVLRLRAAKMQGWTSTVGEILSARVVEEWRSDGDESRVWYRAAIMYGYHVNGIELAGHRVAFAETAMTIRSHADAMLKQYVPGARVTVYFDPTNPKDSILEREAAGLWPLILLAGGATMGVAGAILWWVA